MLVFSIENNLTILDGDHFSITAKGCNENALPSSLGLVFSQRLKPSPRTYVSAKG
jgi:hypothetical protein